VVDGLYTLKRGLPLARASTVPHTKHNLYGCHSNMSELPVLLYGAVLATLRMWNVTERQERLPQGLKFRRSGKI
jgi:hypothetical protein